MNDKQPTEEAAAIEQWCRERAEHTGLVIGAVYAGLAERIARGDFRHT